ncbi:hypothetical protein [Leptospira jelokensis]|uniref:hypothetical protein n=1 Tax=Leptospira jelokensis TaxID=2484931 RepID=UPI00142D4E08|nr:hypothetical protein [Leptospira jelokensis]
MKLTNPRELRNSGEYRLCSYNQEHRKTKRQIEKAPSLAGQTDIRSFYFVSGL